MREIQIWSFLLPSRCKFPKTVDVLHELQTNRSKPRANHPLPPIPEAIVAASAGNEVSDAI